MSKLMISPGLDRSPHLSPDPAVAQSKGNENFSKGLSSGP